MNWQGNVLVWGSLVFIILLIVGSFWLPHSGYTALMLTVGIVAAIVWIVFVIQIAMAMGSDI